MSDRSVEELLRGAVSAERVPGVVACISDRDAVIDEWAFGVGCSSPERTLRIDSIFRIASMTKLATSLAVLMLCERGQLELDAPLGRYLPGYRQPGVLASFDRQTLAYTVRPAATEITIRQLLTHTSGYGYWFLDEPLQKLTRGVPELLDPPFLLHEPGERFTYSSSTDVLGQVFGPVCGTGLADFFRTELFGPLGMTDTGFEWPREERRIVCVHARQDGGFRQLPKEGEAAEARGGGGLFSTARDYLKLLRLIMNAGIHEGRSLLSPASIASVVSNQIGALVVLPQTTALPERSNDFIFMDGTQKFGFGAMLETRDQATGRHAGSLSWGGILNTYFWLDPDADLAAVLFMQVSPFADADCIALYREFEAAVYARLGS